VPLRKESIGEGVNKASKGGGSWENSKTEGYTLFIERVVFEESLERDSLRQESGGWDPTKPKTENLYEERTEKFGSFSDSTGKRGN